VIGGGRASPAARPPVELDKHRLGFLGDCSTPASGRWPGNRLAMAKAKLRVRRLTLPPSSRLNADSEEEGLDPQVEEARRLLDKKKLARITEVAAAATQTRSRTRVHLEILGQGTRWRFKFGVGG
jgi:hypothetical protein